MFNEWYRPAEFGLAAMGANLFVGDQVSALLCVTNAPKNDHITGKQMLAFETALPHMTAPFAFIVSFGCAISTIIQPRNGLSACSGA